MTVGKQRTAHIAGHGKSLFYRCEHCDYLVTAHRTNDLVRHMEAAHAAPAAPVPVLMTTEEAARAMDERRRARKRRYNERRAARRSSSDVAEKKKKTEEPAQAAAPVATDPAPAPAACPSAKHGPRVKKTRRKHATPASAPPTAASNEVPTFAPNLSPPRAELRFSDLLKRPPLLSPLHPSPVLSVPTTPETPLGLCPAPLGLPELEGERLSASSSPSSVSSFSSFDSSPERDMSPTRKPAQGSVTSVTVTPEMRRHRHSPVRAPACSPARHLSPLRAVSRSPQPAASTRASPAPRQDTVAPRPAPAAALGAPPALPALLASSGPVEIQVWALPADGGLLVRYGLAELRLPGRVTSLQDLRSAASGQLFTV